MDGLLHHVEINVSDLHRTTLFWGWLLTYLGYTEHQRWASGISWRRGGTYLVFVQVAGKHAGAPFHRGRVGLNHLAFHLADKDRFEALVTQIRNKNLEVLYPDRHPHAGGGEHLAVFFEDPDRIKVEVVGPPTQTTTTNT